MAENLPTSSPHVTRRQDQLPPPLVDIGTIPASVYPTMRTYWRVLVNRRWTILTVVCVMVTLITLVSFKMRPVFQAASRIEIDAETPQIQSLNDFYRRTPSDGAFLQTQVDVLKSDSLAWKTIEQTRLAESPDFSQGSKNASPAQPGAWLAIRSRLLRAYQRRLQVDQLTGSRMLEVKFESMDPELAARVVNTLVHNYTEYNFQKNYDATRQVSGWMEQRLDELKAHVEQSQQALVDYERRNAIVNVSGKENIVEQKLSELTKELTLAQSDRMKKEALFQTARSSDSQPAFSTEDALLDQLEEQDAKAKAQYVEALDQYGPKFPEVVRLRDQVSEVQDFIDSEKSRMVKQMDDEYQAALDREALLSSAVASQKAAVGKLNELLIQQNLLKGEFETNQQLYDRLLEHLKDATVSAGLKATNVHVVDAALPPTVPVRPKKLAYVEIALAVGLVLGIICAFTQEALDNSISGADEVERLTAAPTLALIPSARSTHARERLAAGHGIKKQALNGSVALSVAKEPDSPLAESYRNLRTSILLSTAPRPPQAILITSTQPLEGKTSTSLNLALSLAQRNTRTLIIDADLRKQGVCMALGVKSSLGLSGVLTGAHRWEDAVYHVDGLSGLSVLPAGPRPPNPAELLSSPAMESLLVELRSRFDHLVLDSPPLLPVTDATVLSALVDGVVLVVECRVTDRGALARAHRMLENAGARVLGTVLNRIEPNHDGYYRSAYRAYYGSRNKAKDDLVEAKHELIRPPDVQPQDDMLGSAKH
ncbi:MAG: GumC family protein [Terriglobia bacterium]